jgi:hypothetical protein
VSITNIGNNSAAAGSATLAITTTAACPAGNAAVMADAVIANVAVNTPTDSASNTWSAPGTSNTLTGSAARMKLHWLPSRLNAGLPLGATITANYGGTTGIKLAAVACIFGAIMTGATVETEAAPTTNVGTAPSLTLTTPTLSTAEIDVCAYTVVTGAADTFTNTTGFSPLARVNSTSALDWEYKIVSDANAVTCAPTLGTSRTWAQTDAVCCRRRAFARSRASVNEFVEQPHFAFK